MNLMTGYLGPTEGEILVDGHSVTREPEKAKQAIGYLPEQPPLYLDMTAEEYLEFAARLKKVPKGDRESRRPGDGAHRHHRRAGPRLLRKPVQGLPQAGGPGPGPAGFPQGADSG